MSNSELVFIVAGIITIGIWVVRGRNPLLQVALVCILADAGLRWLVVALRAALSVAYRYRECVARTREELG